MYLKTLIFSFAQLLNQAFRSGGIAVGVHTGAGVPMRLNGRGVRAAAHLPEARGAGRGVRRLLEPPAPPRPGELCQ